MKSISDALACCDYYQPAPPTTPAPRPHVPRHTGRYRLGCFVLAGVLLCVLAAFVSAR